MGPPRCDLRSGKLRSGCSNIHASADALRVLADACDFVMRQPHRGRWRLALHQKQLSLVLARKRPFKLPGGYQLVEPLGGVVNRFTVAIGEELNKPGVA